jgi:hypothetical protein
MTGQETLPPTPGLRLSTAEESEASANHGRYWVRTRVHVLYRAEATRAA